MNQDPYDIILMFILAIIISVSLVLSVGVGMLQGGR